MQNNEIISLISKQRFRTYETLFVQIVPSHATSLEERKILFYMNIQVLYSHFFVPVQVLEITLRNRIHNAQTDYYKTNNWFYRLLKEDFCTEKTKTMFNKSKNSAKKEIREKNIPNKILTPEDCVGALNFGFWVELLSKEYRGSLFWQFNTNNVFPNKGKVKISKIYDLLIKVQKIRNRLYHYEPLWQTTKKFNNIDGFCNAIEDQFSIIVALISYCSEGQDELLEEQKIYFELAMDEFRLIYEK